jgi:hypothetical protein
VGLVDGPPSQPGVLGSAVVDQGRVTLSRWDGTKWRLDHDQPAEEALSAALTAPGEPLLALTADGLTACGSSGKLPCVLIRCAAAASAGLPGNPGEPGPVGGPGGNGGHAGRLFLYAGSDSRNRVIQQQQIVLVSGTSKGGPAGLPGKPGRGHPGGPGGAPGPQNVCSAGAPGPAGADGSGAPSDSNINHGSDGMDEPLLIPKSPLAPS